MKHLYLLTTLLICCACSVTRQPAQREHTDMKVTTRTVYLPDTVYVELPATMQSVETLDTVSVLENRYAVSSARISGGTLAHTLTIKPVREPAAVQKEIVYRDSLVIKEVSTDRYIKTPTELTPWQNFKIRLGGYAFTLIITLIVVAILYILFNSKLKHL